MRKDAQHDWKLVALLLAAATACGGGSDGPTSRADDAAAGLSENAPQLVFDAQQLLKPETTPKALFIFREEPNGDRFVKACRVDYWLGGDGKPRVSKSMLYDEPSTSKNEVRAAFQSGLDASAPAASVTTWNTSIQLCPDNLEDLVLGVDTELGAVTVAASTGPAGGRAHILKLGRDGFSMRERSPEVMAQVFGGTVAFRSVSGTQALDLGLKLYQYVTVKFPAIRLVDYAGLAFTLDATPQSLNVNTGCVQAMPAPPYDAYAQPCYDRIHASQYRMALGNLTWSDPRCAKRVEGDPVCRYVGDFLYASMHLHDERREFHDGDFFLDPSTQAYIYRIDLRRFLPPGATLNPFKVEGQRTVVSGDLLPVLREALLAAEALGYVPPRLVTGSLTESDAQYLAHYSLSSVNLGYEVSGLSGITFLVNQLRLFGTRN